MLSWAEAAAAGPGLAGGKGWNLGRLARYGFPVPEGFVLPPDEEPPELSPGLYAVRSSVTNEDGAAHSFAGLFQSFLNVPPDGVSQAVRDCRASLFSEPARVYRERFGLPSGRCAVVICRMVRAQVSGVAFTCEPHTGRRDRLCLSFTPGTGEALVGGRVNPREAIVELRQGHLSVRQRDPGLLSDALLLRLARLAARVQWALGEGEHPQDLEWAFDGERFWLLQARPVTGLARPTCAALAQVPVLWSNANLKEILPGVHTTLGWNLTTHTITSIGLAVLASVGYPIPAGMQFTRRISGRAYVDLTVVQWALYDAFGLPPRQTLADLGAHAPPLSVPRWWPTPRRLGYCLRLLAQLASLPFRLPPAVRRLRSLPRVDWRRLSNPELLRELYGLRDELLRFGGLYQLAIVNAALWSRLPGGRPRGTVSARQGLLLYELAAHPERLPAYLEEFGHRAVYELRLENPRWREDPSYLLEQIEALRGAKAPPLRSGTAQPWHFWREAAKSALVAVLEPTRHGLLEAGRRLGVDVFHLCWLDLETWLTGEWDGRGAAQLVADRQERMREWERQEPPDCLQGEKGVALPPAAKGLRGVGVSRGRVRARARVVRHPGEGGRLQRGEILVAPSTDPGWTPLFVRAGGILMEVGGHLSHGAIVAREYGIPAVVNLPGLLGRVLDGEWLSVDGGSGEVQQVPPP